MDLCSWFERMLTSHRWRRAFGTWQEDDRRLQGLPCFTSCDRQHHVLASMVANFCSAISSRRRLSDAVIASSYTAPWRGTIVCLINGIAMTSAHDLTSLPA